MLVSAAILFSSLSNLSFHMFNDVAAWRRHQQDKYCGHDTSNGKIMLLLPIATLSFVLAAPWSKTVLTDNPLRGLPSAVDNPIFRAWQPALKFQPGVGCYQTAPLDFDSRIKPWTWEPRCPIAAAPGNTFVRAGFVGDQWGVMYSHFFAHDKLTDTSPFINWTWQSVIVWFKSSADLSAPYAVSLSGAGGWTTLSANHQSPPPSGRTLSVKPRQEGELPAWFLEKGRNALKLPGSFPDRVRMDGIQGHSKPLVAWNSLTTRGKAQLSDFKWGRNPSSACPFTDGNFQANLNTAHMAPGTTH